MESTSMMGTQKTVVYFDNYGAKLRSETTGGGIDLTIITDGSIFYTLNHTNKTYTEASSSDDFDSSSTESDFEEMGKIAVDIIANKKKDYPKIIRIPPMLIGKQ